MRQNDEDARFRRGLIVLAVIASLLALGCAAMTLSLRVLGVGQ